MNAPNCRFCLRRIIQRNQALTVVIRTEGWIPMARRMTLLTAANLFGEDWVPILEKDEEIGRPIVIDIDDRSDSTLRGGIEFFNEIRPPVEVAVRFPANQESPLVVLLNIRETIKIRIAIDLGELPLRVVAAPEIDAAVAILVAGPHVLANWPDLDRGNCDARHDTEQRGDFRGELPHGSYMDITSGVSLRQCDGDPRSHEAFCRVPL